MRENERALLVTTHLFISALCRINTLRYTNLSTVVTAILKSSSTNSALSGAIRLLLWRIRELERKKTTDVRNISVTRMSKKKVERAMEGIGRLYMWCTLRKKMHVYEWEVCDVVLEFYEKMYQLIFSHQYIYSVVCPHACLLKFFL